MNMEIDEESPIPNHSDLLSKPGSKSFLQTLSRVSPLGLNDIPETSDWSLVRKTGEFNRQYAHAYFLRLSVMRPTIEKKVKEEWSGISLKRIAALCEYAQLDQHSKYSKSPKKNGHHNHQNSNGQTSESHEQHITLREDITVAIIGTIFKLQPDKPSILQEIVEEIQIISNANKENFISEKDILMMEDETGRVRLIPSQGCGLTVNNLVNGLVCGVKGKPNIDGRFEVKDVIWATPKPSVWPMKEKCDNVEMIFVSGLQLGHGEGISVEFGMLFEYLQGLSGSSMEQDKIIGKRSRVYFLGNSFGSIDPNQTDRFKKTAEVANKLDQLLSNLAKTMEVFVISGKTDPVESMYPQPPIHSCLFPLSKLYPSFHLLSNPTRLQIDVSKSTKNSIEKLDVVFSDGETVMDSMRYSDTKCSLQMAQKILQWGHLCPTAPDTLALHPGVMSDIFILKESLPNMFVIGNQKEMGLTEWNGTMIVSVPSFSTTRSVVVFTKDFDCVPMEFNLVL